jgi:DNA-binding protein YbaB
MERMAEDIKHLRKQFNQVQRDLAKFEKRMEKMKTTTSSTKIGRRRG